ncbi:MAG: phosphoribosylformylglycinamidine synthase, partial [Gemmatimonadaceae bacterium]|nr:phosphoribosylformylglycinamidine synthase [Gemmatimonadaceae bacterium]
MSPVFRWCAAFALTLPAALGAQAGNTRDTSRVDRDSAFLQRVERATESPKVYHAEPIAIDLMRDLGARKGEAEWNIGVAQTDKLRYDDLLLFVEYEWAPIDRLGLEVEMPVRFHSSLGGEERVPANQVESFKVAGMYTFQVDTARHWSTALGYLHEVLLNETNSTLLRRPVDGQVFNPFLVTARRWTDHWHTLLYTGPRLVRGSGGGWGRPGFEATFSRPYMDPGRRNFVGLKC